MISVEINFLCDGLDGDCDECFTTEPGNYDLQQHIAEAAVDGGWLFAFSETGQMKCFCYGCQLLMQATKDPETPFKPKKQ